MSTDPETIRSIFYRCFKRDHARCRYCGTDLLANFDAFANMHLDHLKPASATGAHDNEWNRVSACGVCNHLKYRFDPSLDGPVTAESFESCIERSRGYIDEKRAGRIDNSLHRDYQYWLEEFGRPPSPTKS